MKVLVTGSAGHLGEALIRTLRQHSAEVVGLDIRPSAFTTNVGSITDRAFVSACMKGVTTILHAATLHKPHVATHTMQQFVDTNITGTLNLLQEAVAAGVQRFVFTSTTSVFGDALVPPAGAPAAWITEEVKPQPKNIYGVTKKAAEDLCQLFYRNFGLPCIVLRTSRFFPEKDDDKHMRETFQDENLKANEFLFRRVELEDAVNAHLLAAEKASSIGWGVYIISATTPFSPADLHDLRHNAPKVVLRTVPAYAATYNQRGWKIHQSIDRVYVNDKARRELGWEPTYDFAYVVARINAGESLRSPLAQLTGSKGYHAESFTDGPYPIC
ncbi:nucleoside-diphosphate-sugar epimerase [Chitinophaga terrae (ex Kim and Jung 2007)]|uniref:NAD-dependent epimerase/dehydratase family protein n=1 Tax=Chitinophaga terrae (ex Kim and Jung 2007) TaxID=408074 RepID=UPI0027816199|nr:NAD(P)-dependent oxidoreductase [Chitinophaga terrae (ex Kim and Jung 2007)]MDQ0109793.1 nucleoside-diphosphate-sugar epimerase [Chitinophaga terrae (ex Kim and Jung 2007)]